MTHGETSKAKEKTPTENVFEQNVRLPTKSILANVKQFFSCRTKTRKLNQQLSSFDVEPTYRGSKPINQNELFWYTTNRLRDAVKRTTPKMKRVTLPMMKLRCKMKTKNNLHQIQTTDSNSSSTNPKALQDAKNQ